MDSSIRTSSLPILLYGVSASQTSQLTWTNSALDIAVSDLPQKSLNNEYSHYSHTAGSSPTGFNLHDNKQGFSFRFESEESSSDALAGNCMEEI